MTHDRHRVQTDRYRQVQTRFCAPLAPDTCTTSPSHLHPARLVGIVLSLHNAPRPKRPNGRQTLHQHTPTPNHAVNGISNPSPWIQFMLHLGQWLPPATPLPKKKKSKKRKATAVSFLSGPGLSETDALHCGCNSGSYGYKAPAHIRSV